ncbi:MAG: lysophospholipid acyltransferase family protein [bacterium]|nr:lysophospholipid acyltransferase family protein [bacterium]
MRAFLYRLFTNISKTIGPWFFSIPVSIITTGFFLFFPSRVGVSVRFYKAVFPKKSRIYHTWCAWKQYHNFSRLFIDRIFVQDYEKITYTSEGWELLEETTKKEKGGIILMSHMGNWEIAAHILRKTGLKLLLYMGVKNKEQIEEIQKNSLQETGVKIIAVEEDGGSPFDIIDGINFLKEGGLVSMTGDRLWGKEPRAIEVDFFGHKSTLPETPHIFALLSGVPLFIFFVFKTGKRKYHFKISKPIYVTAPSRAERKETIQKSCQGYADILEETVREYPLEWYHFEEFLSP